MSTKYIHVICRADSLSINSNTDRVFLQFDMPVHAFYKVMPVQQTGAGILLSFYTSMLQQSEDESNNRHGKFFRFFVFLIFLSFFANFSGLHPSNLK